MKKIVSLLATAILLIGCAKENPILTIEGGQVQGVEADIEGVYVYRGIPYAAPPIKDLRWKAPQPVIPWEGVLIADRFGHPVYQAVHYPGGYTTEWGYGDEAPYSEDCLYLNVWTKYPGQTDKKLPVALWIHGGGYREGWGSEPEFDAQEWAAKDVVLVSINYRLGVFGFLTHPELSAESPNGVSGNYGILDQIESLKWIKKNIAQFGGDPENVMIFGQSAGAGSVKTLCASPLTKGLFNKAVIMSGGGISTAPVGAIARPEMNSNSLERAEAQAKEILDWAGLTSLSKMTISASKPSLSEPLLPSTPIILAGVSVALFTICANGREVNLHTVRTTRSIVATLPANVCESARAAIPSSTLMRSPPSPSSYSPSGRPAARIESVTKAILSAPLIL